MLRVVVTPEAITLDGRPALIQAGALHYFRLPHAGLWSPVLDRIRMGGLNAVLVPLPWSYHSPEAGFHDFTGPRDLGRLFDDVERAGLWLIPHLGPWVGAGLDAGGLPAWALAL
ncbi:MAG: beta-galactosidase, partial [Anaerolineae bacterium]|nr:beta-galactosidase [Anaerolineae bacterium]